MQYTVINSRIHRTHILIFMYFKILELNRSVFIKCLSLEEWNCSYATHCTYCHSNYLKHFYKDCTWLTAAFECSNRSHTKPKLNILSKWTHCFLPINVCHMERITEYIQLGTDSFLCIRTFNMYEQSQKINARTEDKNTAILFESWPFRAYFFYSSEHHLLRQPNAHS